MSKALNFYPTIDEDQKRDIRFDSQYEFSYIDYNGERNTLDADIAMNKFISLDTKSNSRWDRSNDDLHMEVSISMKNANILYGPEGVAPKSSKIGIALEWFSQKNKVRKVLTKHYVVANDENETTYQFHCIFPKETFDNNIEVNIFLYLLTSATKVNDDELFLNNEPGVMLGELDHKEIYMTGAGSLFPIYTQPSEDKKLWKLEISYEDPAEDQLVDCVKLVFNSKHKDYPYIDVNSANYSEALVNEIIASAITILLIKLKEDQMLDDLKNDYADGSILSFVKYYTNVLGLDISDIMKISNSLRNYLNQGE